MFVSYQQFTSLNNSLDEACSGHWLHHIYLIHWKP